jgi:carbamoyl-phosphate synthase large subunit
MTAYLNEKFSLRGIGCDIADLFTSKYRMRSFLKTHDHPCPDFILCDKPDDALDFLSVHKKIVIKPVEGQSSKGVFIIEDEKTLRQLFPETISKSRNRKSVVAEEFLDGAMFTVEGYKTERKHVSLAISEKRHYRQNPMVAQSLYYSHDNEQFDYAVLRKQNDRMVEEMGLPFGITHAEYIFTKGAFYLVEIAARGGGNNTSSRITPFMSGVNVGAALIQSAFGENVVEIPAEIQEPYKKRCCTMDFFDFPAGKVKLITGSEALNNFDEILFWDIDIKTGDTLGNLADGTGRPGFFIAGSADKTRLQTIRDTIRQSVRVIYDENN